MFNRKFLLSILVVFALSIMVAGGIPRAHAAGPELDVLPATHSNLPAGSTITYQINFANMPAFNGIDISVQTPTTGVISATTIVFSGSVWGFLLTNCVNGVGTGCGSTDAPGVAHFAALDTAGFLVGNGNMFNVTYSVQTATGSTGVNVVFDTVSDTSGNPIVHNDVNAVYGGPSGDFGVSASSPAAVDVTQSAISTISLTATGGFAGSVSLSDSPLPSGLTCGAFSPASLTPPGSASLSCSATTAGSYAVTVTGTSGSLTHTATATFNFVDFTISASSPSGSAGTSIVSTLTVGALNSFAGTVTLSANPPSGLTCAAISPGTVIGAGSAMLSCTASGAGTFSVPISGTDGTLTHSATATFTFSLPQNFGITASSPAPVDATQSAISTVTVTAQNGFTGTVTLSDTPLPSGLTCGAFNPLSITTSGTATLSCSSTTAGSFVVTVTGTSTTPALSHTAMATFNFADFTVSASSPSGSAGTSISSTITVAALNGFAGTVTLSDTPPAGLTCGAITPGTVSGSGTATLSCSSQNVGTFSLPVSGTDGTLTRSATATFTFTAPQDFGITASSPSALDVTQSAVSTITLTASGGFAASVSLSDTPLPSGLTCGSFSSPSVTPPGTATLSCSSTIAGSYVVTITGTSTSPARSHTAMATFNFRDFTISASSPVGPAGTSIISTITIAALNGFSGTVTLSDTAPTGLTCGAITPGTVTGSGTATVSCSSPNAGTFSLPVSGTDGTVTHSATATFTFNAPQDFSITASSPASVDATISATSTISLTASGGFSSAVSLSDTPLPSGLSCNALSPSSVTPPGSATLSCSSTTAGSFTVTVTGTSGSLSHTATATFNFVDFTIGASSPSGVSGSSISSTITVSGLNGFAGTVTLSDTPPSGLTCGAISPGSVIGSGTATVSCSSPTQGTFSLPVSGTDGTLTHSSTAIFTFSAPLDFAIVASSPAAVDVTQSATSTITVTALAGFAGTVTLSDVPLPSGLTCGSITPGTVTGSGTATLTCSATSAGNFDVRVTGTSGSLTHSATATFTFVDFAVAAASPSGAAGASISSTITVTALNGFAGTVTLSDTPPSGLTCGAVTPGTISGSGTATISCSSPNAGTFSLPISGTDGTLTHSATATFTFSTAQNFALAASSPAAVDVTQSATSTISITAQGGFAGSVSLVDTPLPSGLTCGSISPSTITGSGTATLACSSTASGSFVVTITGTSTTPALSHTAMVTFNFVDFSLAATSRVGLLGSNLSSTITIAGSNGFAGTVNLMDTPPTGLTCSAITPGTVSGSGTATVSCSPATAGTFTLPISGSDGTLTRSASATFTFSSNVTKVLLTFSGFDLDDFENGIGQLQVSVNGHLVVDLPSGLNNLTGSGDYRPYDDQWINFGPFDITSLAVQGQNTILFKDPQTSDHFGRIRNVMIVQGDTVLLRADRSRGIYPGFSVTYTFSNPPLTINGFTASASSPVVDQAVTFTATYAGGTGPFSCTFNFGDGESATTTGTAGSCSVTHDYDFSGAFTATVTVRGASTSDRVIASVPLTAIGN